MKKVFFAAALLALAGISVLAQEKEPENSGPVEFHLTFFNFGAGLHIPWAGEGSLDLMMLGMEHRESGMGFEFSPAHLYGWIGVGGGELGWSIINLTLYWNLMPLFAADVNYYLAPFAEINYLVMSDTFYPKSFMLSAGLSTGRYRGDKIKYKSFSVEAGYRMIGHHLKLSSGSPHRMFIGIKFER